MKHLFSCLLILLGCSFSSKAQLFIDNATFFIESGATVTVQGDVTSNASIQGPGKILLKGTSLQNVNMNNGGAGPFIIPNLEIDNTANVALTGATRVATSLLFTNGKIQLGNFNFILDGAASVTGAADNKFLETNGTGFAQRFIGNASASNQLVPVGAGSLYTPIALTHASGTYASALLGAQAKSGKSPASPFRTDSYTNVYWPLATTGVTGGTYTATGTYPSDAAPGFTGTESEINGMSYNGTDWSLTGSNQNTSSNTVSAQLASNSGQLLGMSKFVLMNSRVLLQGANPVSGIMSDALRVSPTVIPTIEPYRSAPYSFSVAQANGGQEVAAASVFNDLATNNNIVDWVWVELRNNVTTGSVIQATRSAFVQKDGDIVDIDGTSPLYFKNLNAGDYTVTVRHRNHLPISTNNAAGAYKNLTLSGSTSVLDFTSPATNVLGSANVNFAQVSGFNMMYSGNTNSNTSILYNGPSNDRAPILSALTSASLPQSGTITNVYSQNDVTMNKAILYNGPNNDRSPILVNTGSQSSPKTQVLPN